MKPGLACIKSKKHRRRVSKTKEESGMMYKIEVESDNLVSRAVQRQEHSSIEGTDCVTTTQCEVLKTSP